MNSLDEQPLHEPADFTESLDEPSVRSSSLPIILLAVAGLALGGLGAWWWQRDEPAPAAPARVATDVPVAPAGEAARPLPALDQMDTLIRALFGALSTSPELLRWLASDDLIRQMANAIDRVSRGGTPARDFTVLAPKAVFNVSGPRRGRVVADAASYRRYDGLAAAVSSIDAQAAARAYITIRPRLDEAYRGLGRTEGTVDAAVNSAIAVLLETPRVSGPIWLVPGRGATYAYADPQLERLSPAQKQLLRMGPENVARVQAWLRDFAAALRAAG